MLYVQETMQTFTSFRMGRSGRPPWLSQSFYALKIDLEMHYLPWILAKVLKSENYGKMRRKFFQKKGQQ